MPVGEAADDATADRIRAHPAADLITDRTAIVVSERPVTGLSSWLTDLISRTSGTGLRPVLVTLPTARVTLPLRMVITAGLLRWVARTPAGGYYDAIGGDPVRFDGQAFVDATDDADVPPQFDEESLAAQVVISVSIQHRPSTTLRLGAALETCATRFTGAPPSGWGVAEPVTQPWDRGALTAFARRRMPTASRLVAVGSGRSPLVSVVEVNRTDIGLQEDVTCLVGWDTATPHVAQITARAMESLRAVADAETVGLAMAHVRAGRGDLTTAARTESALAPLVLLLGPRPVRGLGEDLILGAGLPAPTRVGRPRTPGLLFDLGGDGGNGWRHLSRLVAHLGPDRIAAAAPGLERLGRP